MEMNVKISIDEYFKKNIEIYNKIEKLKQDLDTYFVEKEDIINSLNNINFGVPGVEEEIMAKYLIQIAKRAIELDDKPLLESLENLMVIAKE